MTYDGNFCVILPPVPLYLRMFGEVPTRKRLGVKPCPWASNTAKFRKALKQFPEVLMLFVYTVEPTTQVT